MATPGLFTAAGCHALMLSVDDYSNALWAKRLINTARDLRGQWFPGSAGDAHKHPPRAPIC